MTKVSAHYQQVINVKVLLPIILQPQYVFD